MIVIYLGNQTNEILLCRHKQTFSHRLTWDGGSLYSQTIVFAKIMQIETSYLTYNFWVKISNSPPDCLCPDLVPDNFWNFSWQLKSHLLHHWASLYSLTVVFIMIIQVKNSCLKHNLLAKHSYFPCLSLFFSSIFSS